jgi:hypothetical protein
MPKQPAQETDVIIRARAEKTVANLREHHERGQKANRERATYAPRELSQRCRVNYHTLRKDRRFARSYTEAELDELLGLRRPNGLPLHWGHVIYLITIAHKPERRRIQKQAAKEGWSAPKLYSVLQEKFADGEGRGGRPVKVPPSTDGKLRLMLDETDRWLKRAEAVFGDTGKNFTSEETLTELSATLSKGLKRMAAVSARLGRTLKTGRR